MKKVFQQVNLINVQSEIEFVDNGKDQNQFQGDKLQLNWTFEAQQTAGEER